MKNRLFPCWILALIAVAIPAAAENDPYTLLLDDDPTAENRRRAEVEPTLIRPGPGGLPLPANREIWWSEPPDFEGSIGSSERIPEYNLETEIANDFLADIDRTITLARWWGGYWNWGYSPGDSLVTTFYLRFFADVDCIPGDLLQEVVVPGNANETLVYGGWDHPIYVYETGVEFQIAAGQRYWFVAQGEHSFPPQWGRLQSVEWVGCDMVFRSIYFSYPDWDDGLCDLPPVIPCDVSQEFEVGSPTPVLPTTWGRVKSLYRPSDR